MINPILWEYIISTRPKCECCGEGKSTQVNHCLKHAKRGKHPVPEFDQLINLEAVCVKCHMEGLCHTTAHKIQFKRKQETVRFYNVNAWIESLPYPHNKDFIG